MIEQSARNKLRLLNRAVSLQDLAAVPSLRLEKLKSDRSGQWSIRINNQWRICFKWRDDGVHEVEIVDYH
jgi:proteic killer suppression protein